MSVICHWEKQRDLQTKRAMLCAQMGSDGVYTPFPFFPQRQQSFPVTPTHPKHFGKPGPDLSSNLWSWHYPQRSAPPSQPGIWHRKTLRNICPGHQWICEWMNTAKRSCLLTHFKIQLQWEEVSKPNNTCHWIWNAADLFCHFWPNACTT